MKLPPRMLVLCPLRGQSTNILGKFLCRNLLNGGAIAEINVKLSGSAHNKPCCTGTNLSDR
ncbi:hypothetical protein [Leptolyngbya sp. FACHB-16]|uniref:hypothetical protein n=1 Tax=unclassified Leptolyngbya TaxID=2650499 RepID=UPI001688B2BE|nr:hypothetical protein [Leptolyngbya sp. FACHB-16]MBD2155677.1 hypothetical protein [Leptolyngbya sp. FACHB-16]